MIVLLSTEIENYPDPNPELRTPVRYTGLTPTQCDSMTGDSVKECLTPTWCYTREGVSNPNPVLYRGEQREEVTGDSMKECLTPTRCYKEGSGVKR